MRRVTNVLARPMTAIVLGLFVILAEGCQHFEALRGLPSSWMLLPIPDWIEGALLVLAGSVLGWGCWFGHSGANATGWAELIRIRAKDAAITLLGTQERMTTRALKKMKAGR